MSPKDTFLKSLFNDNFDIRKIAQRGPIGCRDVLGCFDRMLLTLWDALHLDMVEIWSRKRVANVKAADCPELARYFLRGLDIGSQPIFHKMCSFCACLLFDLNYRSQSSQKGNLKYGPPIDKEGRRLLRDNWSCDVTAEPPCFLRCRAVIAIWYS